MLGLAVISADHASSSRARVHEGKDVAPTSILLADDSSVVLNHVCKLLKKHKKYRVVGAVADGETVLQEYSRLKPDLIVLDISMQGLSGIEVAHQLREVGCSSRIIFLTVHEDYDYLNAALGAGGSAYVVKSRINVDLISAIEAVLCNKIFVSSSLLYEQH